MTEPNRRSALLVDLDGTLTDPAEGIVGCFRLALEALGQKPAACRRTDLDHRPAAARMLRPYALATMGDPEEALDIYRRRYSTEGLFEASRL